MALHHIPPPGGYGPSTCSTGGVRERTRRWGYYADRKSYRGRSAVRRPLHREYVRVSQETDPQKQLQGILNTADEKEWHLVGVTGGLLDGGMILFWDTAMPSFGRTPVSASRLTAENALPTNFRE